MCGRRSKQRRLLEPAFLLGLKNWGLGGPRDILPRDRYTAWGGENLQDRFGGLGGEQWRHQVCFKFTHTKENKMEANGAFSQTLIFFQHYFVQHFRARRMQRSQRATIQGKKYQSYKKHFQTFFRIANILYSTRAQRSAFLAQELEQNCQKSTQNQGCISTKSLHSAHTNFPQVNTKRLFTHFLFNLMGGLMRIKFEYLLGIHQQITVRLGTPLQCASDRKC